ncbi:MAG: outer membrane protein assembly factor BamA, partial [Bacteroidetes bacterium SW_10_40_5]
MIIDIDQGEKIKIKNINFSGNKEIKDRKLRRKLEETNQKSLLNLFKSAKFHPDKYEADKEKLIRFYNKKGYRDAKIVSDSVYFISEDRINIHIAIDRGEKYYFRNISWTGNTKYDSEALDEILGIEKGDVYNTELLNSKLKFNPRGLDISSLYMDNGYLFFNVQPVETKVVGNSIDVEIRIREGAQATVDEVTVTGNTKTSDEVILREIRTRPGEKFSRSDIIRSQRELSQLGYFDPQKMEVNPTPNPQDGTVDINYKVSEKPSDKVELQGGWGAGQLVGSLGFVFNNFSLSKLTDFSQWRPLPSGDGQKLSVRAYSNGRSYTSFNFSFTEPWFGGRNPNSLTVSAFHSIRSNGAERGDPDRQDFRITGLTLGIGKRLKWPDDYFTLNNEISFQKYVMNDFNRITNFFSKGESFNISLKHELSRNSVDRPIYPKSGSKFSFSVQYTPPYSSFDDVDYKEASVQRKFKWMEFHKWKFSASDFLNIAGDLVLNSKAEHGYLGYYNNDIGLTPFERFYVGGDGLTGYSLDGRELIRLRGYGDKALTAPDNRNAASNNGASIYTKYTMELRYPITLQKQATIYVLGYGEAGNSWLSFDQYNPF